MFKRCNRTQTQNYNFVNKHSIIWSNCPTLLLLYYFFAQPDCRNFLSEQCNTIIKLQLCGDEWYRKELFKFYFAAIFVAFSPVDAFLMTVVSACIRPWDTNNFTKKFHQLISQECTTILWLKVHNIYMVQKLVGHPP